MGSIVPKLEWLTEGLSKSQLLLAAILPGREAKWQYMDQMVSVPRPWKDGPRLPSAIRSATFRFQKDVQELEEAARKTAAGAQACSSLIALHMEHSDMAFAGRSWRAAWRFVKRGDMLCSNLSIVPFFPSIGVTGTPLS